MNKQELVEAVLANEAAGMESKAAAERAVKAVLEALAEGIKNDGGVQLIGFGSFVVNERKARNGRNPATGEVIKIKASKSIGFKACAALKAAVNEGGKKKKKK